MKFAVLCQTTIRDFITGVRTFTKECHNTGVCDLYLLSTIGSLDDDEYKTVQKLYTSEEYSGTIVSTCLYETDNMDIIDSFPHPRILYLHEWSSLKHGNWRFIDKIDIIAYDRPLLAKSFIDRYPSFDKPYRELTLPYLFKGEKNGEHYEKNIISLTRIAPNKHFLEVYDAAAELPSFNFHIAGVKYKTTEEGGEYFERIKLLLSGLDNVHWYGELTNKEIVNCLSNSEYYLGLTSDTSGWQTYGIEYAAMEAMDAGCIPIVNSEMEYEYRRQGARAIFWNSSSTSAPLARLIRNCYDGGSYLRSYIVPHNYEFLRRKNIRFRNQLELMVKEYIGGL